MVAFRRTRLTTIALSVSFLASCALLVARTALHRHRPDLPPPPTAAVPFPPSAFAAFRPTGYAPGTAAPCPPSPNPTLLAVVHSAPAHLPHRRAIRQTWGGATDVRTVFVVGRSDHPQVRRRVRAEAREHGDLVLPDLPDSYRNLTPKHLSGLGWALRNCPGAAYVMKADDDAFVDVGRAVRILSAALESDDLIACRVVPEGTAPRRSGKWGVTREEYPPGEYPEYCSGLAYFGRPAALGRVLAAALSGRVPRLWIDDVFVTGLAAGYAGVRRLDLGVWYAGEDLEAMGRLRESGSMPWIVVEMQPRHWPTDALDMWRMANGEKLF